MKRLFSILIMVIAANLVLAQAPAMNNDIVKYVKSVIGKKVGRGECWDLAHDALELVNAQWDHKYVYGRRIDPLKDTVYAGDIVHFQNVVVKYQTDKGLMTETYVQHTAIIFEVISPGVYTLAHQNTDFTGKKVGLTNLRLADKKSGKLQFYRPQPL
jgi:hypothetical protein